MKSMNSLSKFGALLLCGLCTSTAAIAQNQTGLGGAPLASFSGPGADFVQGSHSTRAAVVPPPGTTVPVTVPALPAGAVELQSFAVWNYLLDGVPPTSDVIGVNGTLVSGTRIGRGAPDLCWGKSGAACYLADVTGLVLHGAVNNVLGASDKSFGADPNALGEGLTLLSVFSADGKPPRVVDLWAGYASTTSNASGVANASFDLSQPYFMGGAHFFTNAMDGSFNTGDQFFLNGTSVGGSIGGTLASLNAWLGLAGPLVADNLYDAAEGDISAWMSVGDTVLGMRTVPSGDCIGHSFSAISIRVDCGQVNTYCQPKANSLGCLPTIAASGYPSATHDSGFEVGCANVRNNKVGLMFYGINGQASTPFQGGTLCVAAPIKRTPSMSSGGNPAPFNDCSGAYAIDMNAFARGLLGGSPLGELSVVGTTVNCQWWGRDQGFPAPNNTMLSNGLRYVVCP